MLGRIQNDLFDLGADLCRPGPLDEGLRIVQSQIDRLEGEIDALNERLQALDSFILPGGGRAAAALHLARTVVRRAERLITELAETEPVNPLAAIYANRLSDHLFVLARHLNDDGATGHPLGPRRHPVGRKRRSIRHQTMKPRTEGEPSTRYRALESAIREGIESGASDMRVPEIMEEVEARLCTDGRLQTDAEGGRRHGER